MPKNQISAESRQASAYHKNNGSRNRSGKIAHILLKRKVSIYDFPQNRGVIALNGLRPSGKAISAGGRGPKHIENQACI